MTTILNKIILIIALNTLSVLPTLTSESAKSQTNEAQISIAQPPLVDRVQSLLVDIEKLQNLDYVKNGGDLSILIDGVPYLRLDNVDHESLLGIDPSRNILISGSLNMDTPFHLTCNNLILSGSIQAPSIKLKVTNLVAYNNLFERYYSLPLLNGQFVKVKDANLKEPLKGEMYEYMLAAYLGEPGSIVGNLIDINASGDVLCFSNAIIGKSGINIFYGGKSHFETRGCYRALLNKTGISGGFTTIQGGFAGPMMKIKSLEGSVEIVGNGDQMHSSNLVFAFSGVNIKSLQGSIERITSTSTEVTNDIGNKYLIIMPRK